MLRTVVRRRRSRSEAQGVRERDVAPLAKIDFTMLRGKIELRVERAA
jgi:hypothetical protein